MHKIVQLNIFKSKLGVTHMNAKMGDPQLVAKIAIEEAISGTEGPGQYRGSQVGAIIDLTTALEMFDRVAMAQANFVPEMEEAVAQLDPFFAAEASRLLAAHPQAGPRDKYFILASVTDASNQAKALLQNPELLFQWKAAEDWQSRRLLLQGMNLRNTDNPSVAIVMANEYLIKLDKTAKQHDL